MEHINKFTSSQDVQDALDNEVLGNPYIALVNGALDYNSKVPTPPMPECHIEDSDGNIYLPEKEEFPTEIDYTFDFQADVDATWTLYHNGIIVIATGGRLTWYYDCNGSSTQFDAIDTGGVEMTSIAPTSPASYDEPIQDIHLVFTHTDSNNNVTGSITIPYCGEDPSSSGSAS